MIDFHSIRAKFLSAIDLLLLPKGAISQEVKKLALDFVNGVQAAAQFEMDQYRDRTDAVLSRAAVAIDDFVHGRPIDVDRGGVLEQKLHEYREEREATLVPQKGNLPPTRLVPGSSGLEIQALLKDAYDCAEFKLKPNTFQTIFISPWIQFEPAALHDVRSKLAMELMRRAAEYDSLLERVKMYESIVNSFHEGDARREEDRAALIARWGKERAGYGLPEDFSDLNA